MENTRDRDIEGNAEKLFDAINDGDIEVVEEILIWVTGTRTGKKLTKCHFFFKGRSWYGQIKAKIDIILSSSILS